MTRTIQGTVRWISLGMGFWGITTDGGESLRPLELPARYQREGATLTATIRERTDIATAEM